MDVLRARIIGTGSYAPEKVLTNSELEKIVATTDEWITERTGIKERHIAGEKQATSDLAFEAAKNALRNAGVKAKDVDLIIVATMTPDMHMPSTACLLQHRLDAKKAAAFDVNAACSGFLYGLSIANSFIRSGQYKKILLIGAEMLSRFVDWQDRNTCVLFGDGAGAVVLDAASGSSGILSVHMHTDGSLGDLLSIPAGGSRQPASKKTVDKKLHFVQMKGNETFKVAVKVLENLVIETLHWNNMKPSQLSYLVPHQANLRIIQATARRLGLSMDKVIVNISRYGNTSAASIPIALDEAARMEKFKRGDLLLLEAFGGGLTWASALVKW
jgi:3-oxoacyl-[acyl-carrier-protein] synthase-3